MGAVAPPWAAIYSSKLENFCWGGRRLIRTRPGSSLRFSRAGRPGRPLGWLGAGPLGAGARPAWPRPRSPAALRAADREEFSGRAGCSGLAWFLPPLRPAFLPSGCEGRLSRPGRCWGAWPPLAGRPCWLFWGAGRCLSGAAATVLAGRTAVSAPVRKWGSNLACWGCAPWAGRGLPSRRPRRERLRFSPPSRGALFLVSSMMVSSFFVSGSAGAAGCTCRTLRGRAGCAGLGSVGAGCSGPAVSQGWPLTTGIFLRFSFSMPARYSRSSGAQKLTATPSAPARAVRPMRWT